MSTSVLSKFSLGVSLIVLFATGPANAVTVERINQSNAVGVCQPALPAYDGMIRKRPRAVQNEGTSTAFISCAYTYNWDVDSNVDRFVVTVNNKAAMLQSVTCTAVYGTESQADAPPNSVKTASVAANGLAMLSWTKADFGNQPLRASLAVSLSCQLPPQTGVNFTAIAFSENVGQ